MYRALLIANATFPADRHNLADLIGPRADADRLGEALCHPDTGLFDNCDVTIVTDSLASTVLGKIEAFFAEAAARDTLVLYYSGHGWLDQSNQLYLCTLDTRSDRLKSTAIAAETLSRMIGDSAAQRVVVLLDCCHSGAFKGGSVDLGITGNGRFVVTSARASELSPDAGPDEGLSAFTAAIAEGLLAGVEDLDRDGFVKLDDLYDFVLHRLADRGGPLPQKRFMGHGDVPMARRPVRPTTATPPPWRASASASPAPPDGTRARRPAPWRAIVIGAVAGVLALTIGLAWRTGHPEGAATRLSGPTTTPGSTAEPSPTVAGAATVTTRPTATQATAPQTDRAPAPPATASWTAAPTTTAAPDPIEQATALVTELATAYAAHDWATARRLSPRPEFSDVTYEEGFGALFHVDLIVVHADAAPPTVRLWLAEVANENMQSGIRTSLYCVRWDVDLDDGIVTRVSGKTIERAPGIVDPASWSADATAACGP